MEKYDSDGDGFCSDDGVDRDILDLCKGKDLCPQTPGPVNGCTKEQKFKMDHDKDGDGFCDNEITYKRNKHLFKGEDYCLSDKGTEPDGCSVERRNELYKRVFDAIKAALDPDRDGFCTPERGLRINVRFPQDLVDRYTFEYAKDFCPNGVDNCPNNSGIKLLQGCPAFTNEQKNALERRFGKKVDSDKDHFCDPWVKEEGYLDSLVNFCNRTVDGCPDYVGFEKGEMGSEKDGCPSPGIIEQEHYNHTFKPKCAPGAVGCSAKPTHELSVGEKKMLKQQYGDFDSDDDGYCDPWVSERQDIIDAGGCRGKDACPNEWGKYGKDGCPKESRKNNSGNSGWQSNNNSQKQHNQENGLFVNGKKMKFW